MRFLELDGVSMAAARPWRGQEMEFLFDGFRVSVGLMKKVLRMDGHGGYTPKAMNGFNAPELYP